MNILHLTLKKKWFDMIIHCEKKEEYREIKPYWDKRLNKHYDRIRFRNGYSKNAPVFDIELLGVKLGSAKPEWSNNAQGLFYVLSLGKILNEHHGETSSVVLHKSLKED